MRKHLVLLLLGLLLFLCGCTPVPDKAFSCTVVFEECADTCMSCRVFEVDKGQDLAVTVTVPAGRRITGVNYPEHSISALPTEEGQYGAYLVTLYRVRYPVLIRLETGPSYETVYRTGSEEFSVMAESTRLRINSLPYHQAYKQEGMLPIGWRIVGTDTVIGFGSRFERNADNRTVLELVSLPVSDAALFSWELREGGAWISACATQKEIVIPDTLDGWPVIGIAAHAFGAVEAEILAFPPTLSVIEADAFDGLSVQELYMFDSLTDVGDASFGSLCIRHLHLNAVREPVYCGSYFDTLSEKLDYLNSVQEQRKIILFCGSSARFGYDCTLLEAAFPGFKAVNMGVYAYGNMLPQAQLLLPFLREGDIILSSPELDTIETQFCGSTVLDSATFAMVESNYDLLARLDLTGYTGIFDAYAAYQQARLKLKPVSYSDVPSWFDEDGNRSAVLTYNLQGDYILHRPANTDRKLFGVRRAYYNADYIREDDWNGLNSVYDAFTAAGASVFFVYSPRSERSISEDSTPDAITALDKALRSRLHAPVITEIRDSLMDAYYFFGTDNHLTTEGASMHTRQVIDALKNALEVKP